MKVTEHLERATGPLISFEIIPPLRGGNVQKLLSVIDTLMPWRPPFIDITSNPAEVVYEETPGGIQRRVKRKRPGTLGVCALIQNKYNVDAVPHILCHGFTREETEDFLIELNFLGIDNVLAVRGDDSGYRKPLTGGRSANLYAVDLVHQINDMNSGKYLEADLLNAEPTHFCVGVGGYPEKHFECPNMKTEVRRAKEKQEAGAHYIVTQMFFDNEHFFRYAEACRADGVTIPIIPGLKVITNQKQLTTIPRNFYTEIPWQLSDAMMAEKPEHAKEVGIEWALKQTEDLLARGTPSIHFYVMQDASAVTQLLARLRL